MNAVIHSRLSVVFDVRNEDASDTYGSALVSEHEHWVFLYRLHIKPEHRRKGHATALLRTIVERYAGTVITLEPKPFFDEPVPEETLRLWYRRFGFKDGVEGTMFREPGALN